MWRPQTKEAVLREVRIREWRRRIGDVLWASLQWLLVTILTGIATLARWLWWHSAKTAHEVEVNRLFSQRYDKLLRLGETVYALYRTGRLSWEVVEPLCQEIADLDQTLEKLRRTPLLLVAAGEESEEAMPQTVASQ